MSRIGKLPITVPAGVTLEVKGHDVTVKGPKGTLVTPIHPRMKIVIDGSTVTVERPTETTLDKSLHGLSRTLVANMVEGVSKGFEKKLEIQGVGYRGQMKGTTLVLNLGYSHPVEIVPADGIKLDVQENIIIVSGADKARVGETAANIRKWRKPEPYKGKGIRYVGEHVRRKEGKKAAG